MIFSVNKQLLIFLIIGFIISTIFGAISHEFGHYIAARMLGFRAHISYAMTWFPDADKMSSRQLFLVLLAGPLQTIITGTIGFFVLYKSKKSKEKLSVKQWILIFLSLFWLRQFSNLVIEIVFYLKTRHLGYLNDEVKISRYLNWSPWSIDIITGCIGLLVLVIIVFKIIPKQQRLTFVLSGLIGGVSGFILWMIYLGKLIMP